MPKISSRFLLTRNNVEYGELLAVDGGDPTIRMVASAEVKMVLEGTFLQNPEMNLVTDHIKPMFYVDDKKYQMGEFVITDATISTVEGKRKELTLTAYDLTYLAKQSKIENRLLLPKGSLYTAAISSLLVDSGLTSFVVVPNSATFSTDREDWEPGTSRLEIVNDLLAEINYNSAWMDLNGIVQITAYQQPTAEAVSIEYRNDKFSVLYPEDSSMTDVFDKPNVFIAVVENPDLPENLRAEAVNDDPSIEYSTVNRGRIAQYERLDNIASQSELQSYVNNQKIKSMMATQEIEFETEANPAHGAFEILALYKDELTGIYEETEWNFPFAPGRPMAHRARRAIFSD